MKNTFTPAQKLLALAMEKNRTPAEREEIRDIQDNEVRQGMFKRLAWRMGILLVVVSVGLGLALADWTKETWEEESQNYQKALQILQTEHLNFEKDTAIDKLNLATKNQDFGEVERLGAKLKDLSARIGNIKEGTVILTVKEEAIPLPQGGSPDKQAGGIY